MFRSTLICLATALAALVSLVASATTAAGSISRARSCTGPSTACSATRSSSRRAPTQGAARHPLVIAFHGHGGRMLSTVGADAHPGALAAGDRRLPAGPEHADRASIRRGRSPGWQGKSGRARRPRSQALRRDRRDDEAVATRVDRRRIYATGFSNGAVFSLLLWAERAQTIAAIGEVAGRLDPAETLTSPRRVPGRGGTRPTRWRRSRSRGRRSSWPDRSTARPARDARAARTARSTRRRGARSRSRPSSTRAGTCTPSWAPAEIVTFFKAHALP